MIFIFFNFSLKKVRQWIEWLKLNKDELIERQKTGKQTIGHKGLDFKSDSPEQ